jgi:hypothetical protein
MRTEGLPATMEQMMEDNLPISSLVTRIVLYHFTISVASQVRPDAHQQECKMNFVNSVQNLFTLSHSTSCKTAGN